jgi:hypothetical protein
MRIPCKAKHTCPESLSELHSSACSPFCWRPLYSCCACEYAIYTHRCTHTGTGA